MKDCIDTRCTGDVVLADETGGQSRKMLIEKKAPLPPTPLKITPWTYPFHMVPGSSK